MTLPYVRIEVGFTSPYVGSFFTIGDPGRGRVGVDPIGAAEIWSELPAGTVRSWSVRRGVTQGNSPTRRYEPGTLSIVLNDGNRYFDPDNLAGPYVSAGVSQITPMRRVRITAIWNNVAYPIITAYSDDWVPEYIGGFWTYTTLLATDASKIFSDDDRTAAATVGAGELTGARVGRVLDSIGWPTGDRIISTGDVTVQATDLSGPALSELQLVQDTELGEFFLNGSGLAVFQDRGYVSTNAASRDSQAVFGDGGYLATGEIPYADVKLTSVDDALANRIRATRVGGTEQTAQDTASQAAYLTKTHERADLIMQTDSDAAAWANALLYQHKDPVRRVARLEFNTPAPHVEDAFWPQILGREFGDRITVRRRPAGGGAVIEHDAFVRGIEHNQVDATTWTSAWILQATDRYSYFTIGHPTLGRVGVNPIGF